MQCLSPALEDIPDEDWYCSGCKEVDITDWKYQPGDFEVEDAETNDNGNISLILLYIYLQKIPIFLKILHHRIKYK